MKRFYFLIFLVCFFPFTHAQKSSVIKKMSWGLDFKINLVLSNDSTYVLDIEDLFQTDQSTDNVNITYYPVNFEEGYVKILKDKNQKEAATNDEDVHKNIWRALNSVLSGGYAHFLNCLLYALETGELDLTSKEMTRPDTDWKPDPVTDTYKRTKKWKYYVPVNQKMAIKEYKRKKKSGQLADLEGIPENMLNLFLNTRHKEYKQHIKVGSKDIVAKIDMVKLLLGSNYLGEEQIKYIKKQVLNAALGYKIYELPTIIIFNNFNAAVAMSLDEEGYKVQQIVFSIKEEISTQEKENRRKTIKQIVENINKANQKAVEKKLKRIYN